MNKCKLSDIFENLTQPKSLSVINTLMAPEGESDLPRNRSSDALAGGSHGSEADAEADPFAGLSDGREVAPR